MNTTAFQFTFADFFAGIGGMRLALEACGGSCVFSSEWDKFCQKTYVRNFKNKPHGDIRKIEAAIIPNHDILIAGFPCQPFSLAGVSKKKSLGQRTGFLDKTQGTLFFDLARIINVKRPKVILLENVKHLQSHDNGKTFETIIQTLANLDYELFVDILDGRKFVPQHRERIFIVGFDRQRFKGNIAFDFHVYPPHAKQVLVDILEVEVDDKYTLSDKLWNYLQRHAAKHRARGNGFGYGLADLNGASRTLSARYYKDGSEILIPQKGNNPRRLTPRECARLQGFPESFIIPVSDTQAYKQFGNSVVVPLVEAIGKQMIKTLMQIEREQTEIESVYLV